MFIHLNNFRTRKATGLGIKCGNQRDFLPGKINFICALSLKLQSLESIAKLSMNVMRISCDHAKRF